MADKKTYTGLSKNYATVPAFSITTIDYLDTKPNYFRVQNRGTTEIYCSTNNMPTTKHYDFAVAGKKMKMFAEPYNRTRLYIFNPSGTDVEVAVLSFQAEFEPLTLALSEIEVEMPKDFETSMAITSFNAPLPNGNNKIGKVEVTNSPAASDVTAIKANTQEILSRLTNLILDDAGVGMYNLYNIGILLRHLIKANTFANITEVFEGKDKNTETVILNKSTNDTVQCVIHLLINDGGSDMAVKIRGSYDSNVKTLTLKPGESIRNLKIDCLYLSLSGTNYSYRVFITLSE